MLRKQRKRISGKHASTMRAGAASIGRSLPQTEVLMFGNPEGGTPLLECARTVGIDLPLRALVWKMRMRRFGLHTHIQKHPDSVPGKFVRPAAKPTKE